MARKQAGTNHTPPLVAAAPSATEDIPKKPSRPLIFISHDHRDAQLAEAFGNLLGDASGGFLKSFRSSDRKGGAGIEFGAEWYSEIMSKINDATDVVALLTPRSIDRPWILYEAGVAKGKLDKPVFGVVVGVPFEKATRGPFAQFQNSADDGDSLTKLVLQLIKRNSEAEPRDEAVRREVNVFLESVKQLAGSLKDEEASAPAEVEANATAKLFEEVKVMFRDLLDRLQSQLMENFAPRIRRRGRFHPMMIMDMMHGMEESEDRALAWLMAMSAFRDEMPWLYEIGRDVYEALKTGDPKIVSTAIDRFDRSLRSLRRSRIGHEMMGPPELDMMVHELGGIARHLFLKGESVEAPARATATRPSKRS
jgi:hypothetical protein